MHRFFIACLALLAATPALAVVRGAVSRDPNGVRASVVRVENSNGELCSGAMIAPDLVLTAAHCVLQRAAYRVVGVDRSFRPRAVMAVAAAMHPAFVPGTTPRTQPGVDLAILKLAQPLGPDFTPLDVYASGRIGRGDPVALAGFGVAVDGRSATARTLRETRLVTLGPYPAANRVLAVVDEERLAEVPGAGACRGDSGGPILGGGAGRYQLLGIVSWSSGPFGMPTESPCGGVTAVTPVAEHTSWIAARASDLRRLTPGQPLPAEPGRSNAVDWVARGR
jgi:hypothetical protein